MTVLLPYQEDNGLGKIRFSGPRPLNNPGVRCQPPRKPYTPVDVDSIIQKYGLSYHPRKCSRGRAGK